MHYGIKVVVYRDITLDQVRQLYPVVKEKELDYRYIEYHKAINYLNKKIKELKKIGESWAKGLGQGLIITRDKINTAFKTHDVASPKSDAADTGWE